MSNPVAPKFTQLTQSIKNAITSELVHGCDGPVTKFVVLCRAMKLAYNHQFHHSHIADVLDDVLKEIVDEDWRDS